MDIEKISIEESWLRANELLGRASAFAIVTVNSHGTLEAMAMPGPNADRATRVKFLIEASKIINSLAMGEIN